MSDICKNLMKHLQKTYPLAPIQSNEITYYEPDGSEALKIWPMIAQDPKSGIKQRAIAIENLGKKNELSDIAKSITAIFSELNSLSITEFDNTTGHEINSLQMTFSARIILYTNRTYIPLNQILQAFSHEKLIIEIIDESEMHKSLFISYGGPDEELARKINESIKSRGVETWFFPVDAQPGDKLHRLMHNGVNSHDRFLLICSESSLKRPGVLNEIERVLEREAKEGGTEILIPVTLDDYVYSDWSPERPDISAQVKSRVISKITLDPDQFEKSIEKLVKVLKK